MNDQTPLTNEMATQEAVQQAIQQSNIAKGTAIEVAVQGTTVSLYGEVESQQDKDRATRIARGVPNVVDVTNELTVRSGDSGIGVGPTSDIDKAQTERAVDQGMRGMAANTQ